MRACKLLVIGAGAAGISAAVAAWGAGCKDILLVDRGAAPGGILPQCDHKGFGLTEYGAELTGPDYAAHLEAKLLDTGVRFQSDTEVLSVSRGRIALLSSSGILEQVRFERLILAAGCREKSIGSLPIAGTRPSGIFTAGQAQEYINLRKQDPGSEVLILGSGDLGMIIARRFALERKHVIAVLEQNSHYGGMARNYHSCIEAFSIPLYCSITVREIHGEGRIRGVTTEHLGSGKREYIACDTLITALGLVPEQELIKGLEQEDWIFPVGNCRRVHDIVDSAVAEAAKIGRSIGTELSV